MITLRNANVELFNSGHICWINIHAEDQDLDTLKELGRGKNFDISASGISRLYINYKGNSIYKY